MNQSIIPIQNHTGDDKRAGSYAFSLLAASIAKLQAACCFLHRLLHLKGERTIVWWDDLRDALLDHNVPQCSPCVCRSSRSYESVVRQVSVCLHAYRLTIRPAQPPPKVLAMKTTCTEIGGIAYCDQDQRSLSSNSRVFEKLKGFPFDMRILVTTYSAGSHEGTAAIIRSSVAPLLLFPQRPLISYCLRGL